MYYETWEKFDEAATQYIPLSVLSDFVDALEDPLRLPAPNLYKLVSLDIPICEGDRMHCVDILDALTKNFLGTVGDTAGELGDLKKGPDRVDYNPISSTLKRQREMFVARLIQRTWRNFVKRRHAEALYALDVQSVSDDFSDERLGADAAAAASERGSMNSTPQCGSSRSQSVNTAVQGTGTEQVPDAELGSRQQSPDVRSISSADITRRSAADDSGHRTDKRDRKV
jgi:hypothetical protein